jgi:hypothetical protein
MRHATVRAADPVGGFAAAEARFSALVTRLQSTDTAHMSHSELERLLEQQRRELMRQLLQAHLERRAPAMPTSPVVGADGLPRTHAGEGTRPLETVLGRVQVRREGHGARGLCGDVGQVIASIRRTATYRGLSAAARRPADVVANYLEHHKASLRYDQYLDAGLPIATGIIEGACRHLIRDRLTLTGARWSLEGADAILRLRALGASGDWDAYWVYHEQQVHARHHTSQYANGVVPTLTVPQPQVSRQAATGRRASGPGARCGPANASTRALDVELVCTSVAPTQRGPR